MARFVHHTMQPQHNNGGANVYLGEAPCYGYGYGFYYNPDLQNNEAFTPHQYGVFNGLGVSGNGYSQAPVQHGMQHNRPYGAKRTNNGSAIRVQMGPNPYYMHEGGQAIQGDVVQRGNFSGRGMGARLSGHFCVSGDIN